MITLWGSRRVLMTPVLCFVFLVGTRCNNQASSNCATQDNLNWVAADTGCLRINTFKNPALSANPNLVIVIHGDAPFNKPGYQYAAAKIIAAQNRNTIAIGLLRPGYTDPEDQRSHGRKGNTTGDNYTPEVVASVAAAIKNLRETYHAARTVIAAHSGGAAITGALVALYPELADGAVLVACPCDVTEWRKYMQSQQPGNKEWSAPVSSISPIEIAGKVSGKTRLVLISGDQDEVVPIMYSSNYHKRLKAFNKQSALVILNGEGHEAFFNKRVFAEVKGLLGN
ncbi:alpha/beta hydrolase family protein [Hufsiella ginkgonis]|uniref:Prolyl oligopeptidase family serine peptidase n=1 Tax=Hufsiella ginkgonis TaxID=2695274 RepID=A0A7K1Y068_9SPHI|nr:prolyl oligopeptidase family serine peptidase [Hufsiella ginkgonis]MXV16467.1 prolyl oligopeptidase family serine peptidase [Hufsiella ginkgonis]